MPRHPSCWLIVSLCLGAVSVGCSDASKRDAAQQAAPASTTQSQTAADEITEALAKLEPADRAAAIAQGVCPVSEEKLGSMGAPLKVSADGRYVFLCCDGCKEAFEKEPQTFLAKMKK